MKNRLLLSAIFCIFAICSYAQSGVITFSTLTICVDNSITLSSATTGSWYSSNTVVATVSPTGTTVTVNGLTAGTSIISYNDGLGTSDQVTVNVFSAGVLTLDLPNINPICSQDDPFPIHFSGATAGDTWSWTWTGLVTPLLATGTVGTYSVNSISEPPTYVASTASITVTSPVGGCTASYILTVNQHPAGITEPFSGESQYCMCFPTGNMYLEDAAGPGVWTSTNSAVGTISGFASSSSGSWAEIQSISAGTTFVLFAFTVTGCYTERIVRVFATGLDAISPSPVEVCVGEHVWIYDNSPIATISNTVIATATYSPTPIGRYDVYGVSVGTTTVSYRTDPLIYLPYILETDTGCYVTTTVWVGTPGIEGTFSVCVGSTTTLTDALVGGLWVSTNSLVATVDGSTGVVTGVGAGSCIISYTVSGGLSDCPVLVTFNVFPVPEAISGNPRVCAGYTTSLTDATSGGVWSSSNLSVGSIGTDGVVTGVSPGTTTISYTLATSCAVAVVVTVDPDPEPITGNLDVCLNMTTDLTDVTPGGSWSSSDPATGSVDGSGTVTGITPGTVTISYTMPSGCFVTAVVTVDPVPATILGAPTVCVNSTITLSDLTTDGSWSSSNVSIGTIGSTSGIFTGLSAGTTMITYMLPITHCYITTVITVNPLPSLITGTFVVCVNSTTILSDATAGGTWSSSNTAIGSVDGSGDVTGVSAGIVTITYTLSSTGCYITTDVTVNPIPELISGTFAVCVGLTTNLNDATAGGTWSSSNTAIGSVDGSGDVTGVSAGIVTITYTISSTGCYVTADVTVNPNPSPISGAFAICILGSTTFTDPDPGGTWSSSDITIATIGSSDGVANAVSPGVVTISYTFSTGCFMTATLTVNPLPGAITGPSLMCPGGSFTLTDTPIGGTWSSSDVSVGTIDAGGTVTGITDGTTTITYAIPGCYATTTVTVSSTVSPILGADNVCQYNSETLSDLTYGGTWSSGPPTVATISEYSGILWGVVSGVASITYTVPGCPDFAVFVVTVNPTPTFSYGAPSYICGITSFTILIANYSDGVWSSDDLSVASVGTPTVSGTSSEETVFGVSAGTATISYTTAAGCTASTIVTVSATIPPLSGPDLVCVGSTITLSDYSSPYGTSSTWSSSNTSVATAGGIAYWSDPLYTAFYVTGVSAGTTTITYTTSGGCSATAVVYVQDPSDPCSACSVFSVSASAPSALGTSGTISSSVFPGDYFIGNDVTIVGNVTFSGAVVLVASGVTVYIDPGSSLTLDGCHFFSCSSEMWQGFVLNHDGSTTGTITLGTDGNSTLIEDAITGVDVTAPNTPNSSSPYFISSYSVIFNKCNTGISISNYSPATSSLSSTPNVYEFSIGSTVFTSRDFSGYGIYPESWPNTDYTYGLKTSWTPATAYDAPFNISNPDAGGTGVNYPATLCNNSNPNTVGIHLANIGTATYPSYSSVQIGMPRTSSFLSPNLQLNLFDALNDGILASNSNTTVYNSAFSNIYPVIATVGAGGGGYGISATANDGNRYQLDVDEGLYSIIGTKGDPTVISSPNSFYNCTNAVYSKDYFHIRGNKSYIVTTQTSGITIGGHPTYWGYHLQSSSYDSVIVTNNLIYNTANAISFVATHGAGYWISDPEGGKPTWIPGDQYDGDINVSTNNIYAAIEPYDYSTSTRFCNFGISIQNIISSADVSSISPYIVTSTDMVRTDSNLIVDAYRGILVQSFWMHQAQSLTNTITVSQPHPGLFNNFPAVTYGINHTDCSQNIIASNTVIGEPTVEIAIGLVDSMRAYYLAFSPNASVTCNTAKSTGRGFDFFGPSTGSHWIGNGMSDHYEGMVLNGAVLGTQGFGGAPSDNYWDPTAIWDGTHAQTYVYGFADAFNSILYVRSTGAYQPYINLGPNVNFNYSTSIIGTNLTPSIITTTADVTHLPPCLTVTGPGNPLILLPMHEKVSQKRIIYADDSCTHNWLGQFATWQTIKHDSTLRDSSDVLNMFHSLCTSSRYAHLTDIERSLLIGDSSGAAIQLGTYVPPLVGSGTSTDSATGVNVADDYNSDYIVDNFKAFYGVYLDYMSQTMTTDDSSMVAYIAGLCPSRFGTAVYKARGLYTVVFNELRVWNDDSCAAADTGSHSSARHNHKTDSTGKKVISSLDVMKDVMGASQRYDLFPNPNDGQMTLTQMIFDNAPVVIEVTDVLGKKVYKDHAVFINGSYSIVLSNIPPGIYLMQLTDSKERKFIFKFVKE